jgi:hypothetical protein
MIMSERNFMAATLPRTVTVAVWDATPSLND